MKRRTFLQAIGAALAAFGFWPRDEWRTLSDGPYVWTAEDGRIVSGGVMITDEASGALAHYGPDRMVVQIISPTGELLHQHTWEGPGHG